MDSRAAAAAVRFGLLDGVGGRGSDSEYDGDGGGEDVGVEDVMDVTGAMSCGVVPRGSSAEKSLLSVLLLLLLPLLLLSLLLSLLLMLSVLVEVWWRNMSERWSPG